MIQTKVVKQNKEELYNEIQQKTGSHHSEWKRYRVRKTLRCQSKKDIITEKRGKNTSNGLQNTTQKTKD
jgi:hypothetical protein